MALYARLWTDILGDEKLMRPARKGAKQLHLLPWLFAFAKKVDDDGRLTVNGEAAEPDDIAAGIPCVTPRQVAQCLTELEAIGVLTRDADSVLRLEAWEHRSGKPSDGKEAIAERVRRHRKAKRDGVTPCNACGNALPDCECNATEIEQETKPEIEQKQKQDSSSSVLPSFDASKTELVALLGSTALAHQEVETFLAGLDSQTRKVSWVRNLATSLQGMGAPAIPPAAMLSALIDFNLADRGASPYNGAVFRAFVDRAGRPKLESSGRKAPGSEDDEAAIAVAAIRALIETNGPSKFIKRERVEAMGPKVLGAYLALGGADRFLTTTADKLTFLQRDFAQALRTNHAA